MVRGGNNGKANNNGIQDPTFVYYVASSDGPHYVAIKSQLNTSNYQSWECFMHIGLGMKS